MESSGNPQVTPEERIVAALAQARERDVAPPRLHAQIRALHEQRAKRPVWRGTGIYAGAFATAVAAIVAVVILVAPGGTPGAPTLAQAVALANRPIPAHSAPAPAPHGLLALNIGGITFPSWASTRYGSWRAIGRRFDRIDGRPALTVFYRSRDTGHEVAYTIVGGTIAWPHARVVTRYPGGPALRTLTIAGRTVTTWREKGDTCIVSAAGVPGPKLERLVSGYGSTKRFAPRP